MTPVRARYTLQTMSDNRRTAEPSGAHRGPRCWPKPAVLLPVLPLLLVWLGCSTGTKRAGTNESQEPSARETKPFVLFMTQVYPAWKAGNWDSMATIVAERVDIGPDFFTLINGATAIAAPGMRDTSADWTKGEPMTSVGLAELAFTLVASKQGAHQPEGATLATEQRAAAEHLWEVLYFTALTAVGTGEQSTPVHMTAEPREKLAGASRVAELLRDSPRRGLSALGNAWLQERAGNFKAAAEMKSLAADLLKQQMSALPWPPIEKQGDQFFLASPQQYERSR